MLRRSLQLWIQGQLIPLLGFLLLLTPGFQQFALDEEGLVCELGLIPLRDSVSRFMVAYYMLQDHEFEHFLCFSWGEFALEDEVTDVHGQCMYTLALELPNIRKQFVLEGPEVLLRLDSSPNSI